MSISYDAGMRMTRRILTVGVIATALLSGCGSDSGSTAPDAVADDTVADDTEASDVDSGDTDSGDTDSGDTDSGDTDSGDTSGSGGGTVTIDGAVYTFEADFMCLAGDDFIVLKGPGTGPDGGPVWVDIESSSDDAENGGEPDEGIIVAVSVGVNEIGQSSPDGQPDFYANNSGIPLGQEVTFERTDNSVSGSGFMTDDNYVVADFD
jgi:hypothetical protein